MLNFALLAANSESQVVQGVHNMLTAISNEPFFENGDRKACQAYLSKLDRQFEIYYRFVATNSAGDILCASSGFSSSEAASNLGNLRNRSYYQIAITEKRFVGAGYVVDQLSHAPVAIFALPVIKAGKILGLAATSLRLEAFTSLIQHISPPKGAAVSVVDSRGIVLASEPNRENVVGKSIGVNVAAENHDFNRPRSFEKKGSDGVTRLYAVAPAVHEGHPIFYIVTTLDIATLAEPAKRSLLLNLLVLALVLVLIMIAMFITSWKLLVIPVRRLVSTTKQVAQGNLKARSKVSYESGELGELAHHFDDMAASLEKREQESQAASQYIQYLAFHDQLTKLPNRHALLERLPKFLAEARERRNQIAILFIDLDRFRVINHSLGHLIGDQLLIAVSEKIQNCLGSECLAARVGGNEFVCVVPNIGKAEEGVQAANRLLDSLSEPYITDAGPITIGAHVGISVGPTEHEDSAALIKYAEVAMHKAKASDKRVTLFAMEMNEYVVGRFSLEKEMRRALAKEEFVLYYQPQISLQSNRIIGAEALVRWQHPEKGLISPTMFIALAEETKLILALGEWTLRTACFQSKAWQDKGLSPGSIAVNVSAHQLTSPGFVDTVKTALHESGQASRFLELEITEGVLLNDLSGTLQALRDVGISLSIDDFGTGYSSLSYIKNFPVNKLKIDQSFIRDVIRSPDDRAITKAIITIAKSLNLKVVAEGVESLDAYKFLQLSGCDAIQGHYYSKPVPANEFAALLERDGMAQASS